MSSWLTVAADMLYNDTAASLPSPFYCIQLFLKGKHLKVFILTKYILI